MHQNKNLYQIYYMRAPGQEGAGGGGERKLPMIASTGRLRPKGVPFSGLKVYERVGILLVDVYIRVGDLSFGSVKVPKGLTDEFYGFKKSRKRSIFVIDSYLKDSTLSSYKRCKGTICQKKAYNGYFFVKNGI